MAEPIQHKTRPRDTGLSAQGELQRLLETLHQGGVLRLLNDWVATSPRVTAVVVQGLKTEGASNAVQNLGIMAQMLGRIPPARLYRMLSAVEDGIERTTDFAPEADAEPPGVTGAYKLLKDEALWAALTPMIEGLKAFSYELNRRVDTPSADLDDQQAHVDNESSPRHESSD